MYPKHGAKPTTDAGDRPGVVIAAAAVRDAAGTSAAPGAVGLVGGRVVAAGDRDAVLARMPGARRVDRPGALLLPGLVNAHAHLDLTSMGPRRFTGRFTDWLGDVAEARSRIDFAHSAELGVAASLAGGVVTVGDIAGSPAATAALVRSPLRGVSFIELFGIGIDFVPPRDDLVEQVNDFDAIADQPIDQSAAPVRVGLQPHAPYSAGPDLYQFAERLQATDGLPICTHLAESPEELQFVAEADGPFRELLIGLGKWRSAFAGHYSEQLHPVNWLLRREKFADDGAGPRWLAAHCNYLGDRQVERLAETGTSVAYCPRASAYFGHAGHRYRDLLAAGVNVCLGTDSIVCHGDLSVLEEMRLLRQRDGVDSGSLLAMATVNGMTGLGLDPADATFASGASPGVIALPTGGASGDPLDAALDAAATPSIELLATPAGANA